MNNTYLQKKRIKKELTKTLLHKFYIKALIYAACIISLFGIGYYVCSQRIWYIDTPFYFQIAWLHDNWFACFLFFFVVGILLLIFWYFMKFIRIAEYMLDEIEAIAEESTVPHGHQHDATGSYSYVRQNLSSDHKIPKELQSIQLQINQIREEMYKNQLSAKEANQRKNDLIVYMAHDLKTPLTSVIGYLNLLHDEKDISPELQDKYTNIALQKAQRLEELINEFFDITRLQLSTMTLQRSNVNLERMIEQIAYEFRPQLMEKNIDYRLHLESNLEINCDIDKISRVFDNLLKNAMHYSYEHTSIHISAYRENEDCIIIQIDNCGRTIPQEKLQQLFEPFFRMDSSRASYSGGAGLGLAIAKEIVEAHEGTITCSSKAEHICFKIMLPVQ